MSALQRCHAFATRVEEALADLDIQQGPLAQLPGQCAAFRRAVDALANRRGLGRLTVGIVGPRNAGKTTVAGLLIQDSAIRDALPRGLSRAGSTRRILWIGPEKPLALEESMEAWIACPSEALADVGLPCQIVDVPGFNDLDAATRLVAKKALEDALVKILVVDERDLEAVAIRSYLQEADGATIVPVINRAGGVDPADIGAFVADLRSKLASGRVLDPILIPDFNQRDHARAEVEEQARAALVGVLRNIAGQDLDLSAFSEPQLLARLRRFRAEVRATAREAFPSVAAAVDDLNLAEREVPREVLADVLGPERALEVVLRQRFRARWLENTPVVFFPWRLVLGVSQLIWGALDRLPLILMGSVPSLVTVAWTAVRNVRRQVAFREATRQGLRSHVAARAAERLSPRVRTLRESLAVDLGRRPAESSPIVEETRVEGIGLLQERSTTALETAIEHHAPGRASAVLVGGVGFVLFWIVAGWPLWAVYHDYFAAVTGTWAQARASLSQFPAPAFSQVLTTVLLALLPMGAWLLLAAAWMTRKSRIARCASEVRAAHAEILRELLASGQLRVRLQQRALAACRFLLEQDMD